MTSGFDFKGAAMRLRDEVTLRDFLEGFKVPAWLWMILLIAFCFSH